MKPARTRADADPGWLVRSPSRLQMAVLVLVGAISLLGVFGIEKAELQRRHAALERNGSDMAAALRQLNTEHEIYLRAVAALIAARDPLTAQDFDRLQGQLDFDRYRQGSLAVGWAQRAATGADAFPVRFVTPGTGENAATIGFDTAADPTRRAAMDQAAALDAPVATGRVRLAQDAGGAPQAGFVIYMPVFAAAPARAAQGHGPAQAGSRPPHGRLRGYVYMSFRAPALLAMARSLSAGDRVGVAAYDGAVAPDRLMASLGVPATRPDAARRVADADTLVETVMIVNRPWQLVIGAQRPAGLSRLSQITILSGVVVALLLAALIRLTYQKINEERQMLEWRASEAGIRNSLTRELNHRVKNTLATVLSIVTLTRRRETDLDSYVDHLSGRIRALSATHDLLTSSDWSSIELRQIIVAELAPYLGANEDHVSLDGPEIRLAPSDALTLGLAVHELATNAAKYGALSVLTGRIEIRWRQLSDAVVEIHWRECGGPIVAEPSKRGFGRDLIEKILARELDSTVKLNFAPDGLQCVFHVPLRKTAPFVLRAEQRSPAAA